MRASRACAVVALVLVSACGSGSSKSAGTPSAGSNPTTASGPALRIAGFAFSPKTLTVAPGASVSVTDSDSADHTVTSDTAGLFSVSVSQGTPVTLTAPTKPGTYTFHCSIHPSMKGSLTVS